MAIPRLASVLLVAALLAGCSGVDDLSGGRPKLTDSERDDVRVQVEKALQRKRFNLAWNQEVQAGADRARLETIALGALRARSRHAGDMFAALRERHGGLSEDARAAVGLQTAAAVAAGRWHRAVAIELMTAEDPPAYRGAWAVYRDAPPDRAPALLEAITDAKQAHAESAD